MITLLLISDQNDITYPFIQGISEECFRQLPQVQLEDPSHRVNTNLLQ